MVRETEWLWGREWVMAISYPESSGSLVSGVVARRDSGIMEFLSHESWDSGFIAHA